MPTTLQAQIDFLKTAASDGVDVAFKRHGDEATFGEAQGLKSLSDADLQNLYVVNKAIAKVRTGDDGDATAMSTNNLC